MTAAETLPAGTVVGESAGARRKRLENKSSEEKIPSLLCDWKQAAGEFSKEVERKRGRMRDERNK